MHLIRLNALYEVDLHSSITLHEKHDSGKDFLFPTGKTLVLSVLVFMYDDFLWLSVCYLLYVM